MDTGILDGAGQKQTDIVQRRLTMGNISKREKVRKQTFNQVIPGGVVEIDLPGFGFLACCGCGLVHLVLFEVVKGKLVSTWYRDETRTLVLRKQNRKQLECLPK